MSRPIIDADGHVIAEPAADLLGGLKDAADRRSVERRLRDAVGVFGGGHRRPGGGDVIGANVQLRAEAGCEHAGAGGDAHVGHGVVFDLIGVAHPRLIDAAEPVHPLGDRKLRAGDIARPRLLRDLRRHPDGMAAEPAIEQVMHELLISNDA